jgi:mRNA-degrading endonuclease toxin of MazEF toxin-antitoxin module
VRQFDVCPAQGRGVAEERRHRLVVVLQHHDFEELAGVVVAPMYLASELPPLQKLRPQTTFKRKAYVIAIDRLASVPKRQLGAPVGNLESLRYEMSKALDLIFVGF